MDDEISPEGQLADLLGGPIDQKDECLGRRHFEIIVEKQNLVSGLLTSKWAV